MKNHKAALLIAVTAFLTVVGLQPLTVLGQGSLTPPGAPAPTMKTLSQVEPRTPITAAPVVITNPGSYYLTTNLTVTSGDAITIGTNGVTLDLNGFTILSTAAIASGSGILINSGLGSITICNGHIRCGASTNGIGFAFGISYSGVDLANVLVSRVSVSGCLIYGIFLPTENSTVVESCTVRAVGNCGIRASTIKACCAVGCGDTAIEGDQVSDCRGESTSGNGVSATTAQNCCGLSSSGHGVVATTAQNCYGHSGTGIGLYATTAQNCYGYSSSGTGLYAIRSATGCHGSSSTGPRGLYAQNASFCTGSRPGGRAIEAIVANGCYATAGTNFISYEYNMP